MKGKDMDTVKKTIILWTIPALTAFGLITAAVWGKGQAAKAEEYSRIADEYVGICVNACSRCAGELSDTVDEMNVSLSKLRVTASIPGQILALEDVVRESGEAAALLTRLPRSQVEQMELESFLTRAGDYCRSLSKKLLRGGTLESGDRKQLEAISESCSKLNGELCAGISGGYMPVGTEEFDYYDKADAASADEPSEPEYPTLIYDGPFSESTEKLEPVGAAGEEGTLDAARAAAEAIAGIALDYTGKTEGRLPTYDFSSTGGGKTVSITVRGLHTVRFMAPPSGDKSGLPDADEYSRIIKKASESLEKLGYSSMEPTYEQYYDGAALISFVWKTDGALVYNDMVKVWIDRAGLTLIGLDARNYLFCHRERDIAAPKLTAEEARASVSPDISVDTVKLALIPLTPQTETLCYEFYGRCGEDEFAVYVNAETGEEEQIFRIISDENGRSAV